MHAVVMWRNVLLQGPCRLLIADAASTAILLAGVPTLILPETVEQGIFARAAAESGLAHWWLPSASSPTPNITVLLDETITRTQKAVHNFNQRHREQTAAGLTHFVQRTGQLAR